MKAVVYSGAVIRCAQTAAIDGNHVNTDSGVIGGLDILLVQIVDTEIDVTGYSYNGSAFLPSAQILAPYQAEQIGELGKSYLAAIARPVSFTTAGGATKTYDADPQAVANVQNTLLGYQSAGETPVDFYWIAHDDSRVSPFTYADLQGLAAALMAQGWASFKHLQDKKDAVRAATTIDAVRSVVW